jgi:hypothetical protein
MAIFFLLVGLVIKREAVKGALAGAQKAALPLIAALGGFVVPVAIYDAINWADAQTLRGWAVPAAAEIAFALGKGICVLLGHAVPASLKTFLLALAIIDDPVAIGVIAVFYNDKLSTQMLMLAGIGLAALAILMPHVRKPSLFLRRGQRVSRNPVSTPRLPAWLWVSSCRLTAMTVKACLSRPNTRSNRGSAALLCRSLLFLPKPGCHSQEFRFRTSRPPIGFIAGLFVGKQLGVFDDETRIVARPADVSLVQLYGISLLTGIGFTVHWQPGFRLRECTGSNSAGRARSLDLVRLGCWGAFCWQRDRGASPDHRRSRGHARGFLVAQSVRDPHLSGRAFAANSCPPKTPDLPRSLPASPTSLERHPVAAKVLPVLWSKDPGSLLPADQPGTTRPRSASQPVHCTGSTLEQIISRK